MSKVCIVAAQRTPFGRFGGALKSFGASELAVAAGKPLLSKVPKESVDQVIVGNVLGAGQGMNVARQVGMVLGLPQSVPAYSVNMVCGSGLQAVLLATQAIEAGHAKVVLCGGTESMSNAPHLMAREHRSSRFGPMILQDSILVDGLTDAFDGCHMAATAERLAQKYQISREAQDVYASQSQNRYEAARKAGRFDSQVVTIDDVALDEHPRPGTTAESLASLRPAFDKEGTITAGNASGINDGAAMLLVACIEEAESHGWPILATIDKSVAVGCDPKEMGLGPVHAIRNLMGGESIASWDAIEINEAFAAQVLACLHELGLPIDRVNADGGAIAMGHPIATSGARLVVHLCHQIHAGRYRSGIASLCIGGGQGIAMSLRAS